MPRKESTGRSKSQPVSEAQGASLQREALPKFAEGCGLRGGAAEKGRYEFAEAAALGAVASTGSPVTPRELESPSKVHGPKPLRRPLGPVSCSDLLEIRSRFGAFLNGR